MLPHITQYGPMYCRPLTQRRPAYEALVRVHRRTLVQSGHTATFSVLPKHMEAHLDFVLGSVYTYVSGSQQKSFYKVMWKNQGHCFKDSAVL